MPLSSTSAQGPASRLRTAVEAVRVGGEVIRSFARDGYRVQHHGAAYNLVTEADVAAERAIVAVLLAADPQVAILAEEASHSATAKPVVDWATLPALWVLDPLDGTNNFAHDIPHFAVSLAYYEHGSPVVGVIYDPLRDELFTAVRGEGAFYQGQRVQVGPQKTLSEIVVGVGFYYDRGAMMEATLAALADLFRAQIHGVRRFGAASLDLCYVGLGRFGLFFEYELAPWDFAAGRLFVEEAGGRITTCAGQPLGLTRSSVLATNGHVYEAALAIVGRHWPPPPNS